MVKRNADRSALAPRVPIKDLLAEDPFMALPIPGPMTPSSSPSCSSADEPVLIIVEESVVTTELSVEDRILDPLENKENCPKKIKTWRDASLKSPPLRGGTSQVSTAASTPAGTPASSPLLRPSAAVPKGGELSNADYGYGCLSILELREELGVAGTELAVGWEKAELVGVLEYLDRICLSDPEDSAAMEI
jgi:hypothetical protein